MQNSYQPKETIIAKVEGIVLEPIRPDQIEFKRNNVIVPLEYGVSLLGDNYYLWAKSPQQEGNYTLLIKNVPTYQNGSQAILTLKQDFKVSGNMTDYSVTPGIMSSSKNFSITVEFYRDKQESIQISFPTMHEFILKPGKNELPFSPQTVAGSQLLFIKIGKYSVPAYLTGNASQEEAVALEASVLFEPRKIERQVVKGSRPFYTIAVKSQRNDTVLVKFSYNDKRIKIIPDKLELKGYDTGYLNLSIAESLENNLNDKIYAKIGDEEIAMPLSIAVSELPARNLSGQEEQAAQDACKEAGGVACITGETCVGSIQAVNNKACCIGVCKQNEQKSSSSIWGWALALLIMIVVVGIYFKYKKSPKIGLEKNIAEKPKFNVP